MLLVKLLNLTQSDNDHECLSAIRKANELLKNKNLQWDEIIFFQKEHKEEEKEKISEEEEERIIESTFKELFKVVKSKSILSFLTSLQDFWKTHGYLTNKQLESLFKTYKNIFNKNEERKQA